MTETMIDSGPRLWTPQGFREDRWTHAESAEALDGSGCVILPLAVFLGLDEATRETNAARLGVHILPGEGLDAIVPHLPALPLVSLVFPAFSDGRSYSKAGLLRGRYRYRGIVRASGDVLIDQIPLMLRSGFTEFVVSNPTALKRLEQGRVGGIPIHFQPGAQLEPATGSYSWRRQSAA